MSTKSNFRADVNLDTEVRAETTFLKLKPRYLALPQNELVPVNLDSTGVSACVVGSLSRILPLRDQAAALPGFDVACIDDLEDLAYGLAHAHALCTAAVRPDDMLIALNHEAIDTRTRFHAEINSLRLSGVLDTEILAQYTGIMGYKRVVQDVRLLVTVYRQHWAAIQGKTPRSLEELDRAEAVANRMMRLVGLRERNSAKALENSSMRARAFSLLVLQYEHVRRAVHYLRWFEEDADEIAPSLYAGKTQKKEVRPQPPPPDQPRAERPANLPSAQAALGPKGPYVQPDANQAVAHNPGLPGSSPVVH